MLKITLRINREMVLVASLMIKVKKKNIISNSIAFFKSPKSRQLAWFTISLAISPNVIIYN